MKRDNSCLLLSVVLFAAISLSGCGGGGSSSLAIFGAGSTTVTGTVTGTSVIAVDENGNVAASCVATGSPPAFTLTLLPGHSYRFFFVQEEGTPAQRAYLLYDGTTTTFSFLPGKTYNLGAVTMDPVTGKATPGTGLVSQAGVTAAGTDGTLPAVVATKIHSGRDWKFFPSDNEVFVYDGITAGMTYVKKSTKIGTEILSTSYGSVQTTKVVHNLYRPDGSLFHSKTEWMGSVNDKLIMFKREIQGVLDPGERLVLDFPLYEGKTWTAVDSQGRSWTARVENTDMTLNPPIGQLTGVVKMSYTTSGGVWNYGYYHRNYTWVKSENSAGESEVLRSITSGGLDTTPPALVSSIPTTGATGLPTNLSRILFEFSEPMGSGSSVTWTGVDNSYFSIFGWSPDNTWGGFSLTKALPADTTIGWTLHGGLQPGYFSDMAGNPLPTTSGSFQTSAGPDTTPPTLVSSNPADGATGVSTSLSSISYTFSEPIVGYSVTWTGIGSSYHSTPTWSADRKTVTFPLVKALPAGTIVSWTLNDPAYSQPMRDLAGNTLPTTSGSFATASTGAFTQSDLTGTWDEYEFGTDTFAPTAEWFRGVMRFDGNGHMIIDDNTTFEASRPSPVPPNGDTGMIMTISSSGVVSRSGSSLSSTTFHGTMASNKSLIVGTVTQSATERSIMVFRKRVPGVTYTNADLFNKSFTFHILSGGDAPRWERGDGSIDSIGSVTLANRFDSAGGHATNDPNVARFSVSLEGIVTDALDADFKGFLTPDKKVLIGTNTTPIQTGVTNYSLMVVTISGGSFAQADLVGNWNFHNFGAGASSEWSYGTLTIDASGTGTHSGYNSSAGYPTPPSSIFNITSNGEITTPANLSWHGTISSGKDLICATATTGTGEYNIYLGVK